MMGSTKDPQDGGAVAAAVFGAVAVYGVCITRYYLAIQCLTDHIFKQVFFVFCLSQAWLHMRESRRGAISL
jgi:ribonuclease kappa